MKTCPRSRNFVLSVLSLGMPLLSAEAGPISDEAKALVEGNTRFALDVYRELATTAEGNVFISPWSISTAFGMTWAGARGATAGEMAAVLHFPFPQAATHPLFGELIGTLDSLQEEGKVVVKTANAVWPSNQATLQPGFLETVDRHYGAHAESLDYLRHTETSRRRINGWVADHTEDRIPNLLPEGSLKPETAMVLTNAVYFNGAWQTLFDPEKTFEGTFQTEGGGEIDMDFMNMQADLRFHTDESVVLVTLPYHGESLEAVLISPRSGDIRQLESVLTPENLADWLDRRSEKQGTVILPRFSLRYRAPLVPVLKSLGMFLPFQPVADFSGMFDSDGMPPRQFQISDVLHEAFLEVREEGTEAAAATGIVLIPTGGPGPPTFDGTRPFLFLIRDTVTGSLLFIGRVSQPEPLPADDPPVDADTVKTLLGEESIPGNDGWWETKSIGRFRATSWPWLEHPAFGRLCLDTRTADPSAHVWLFGFDTGWLFSSTAHYPDFWSEEYGWLYTPGDPSATGWIYRYADQSFFLFDK